MVSLNKYKNISDDVYQFSIDLYHKILFYGEYGKQDKI